MRVVPLLEVAPFAAARVGPFHGTRPYLATGGLDDDASLMPEPVTYEERPSRADLTVQPGDVCFARMQGTEKILEFDADHADLILSTGFAVLRPMPDKLYPRFLRHWLRTREFQSSKDQLCSGATQKAITNEKIEQLTIPLPRIDEQRRIAEILDRAEALRTKRRAAIAQLDILTQAIFLDLFGDPTMNPKGWPMLPFGEVCESRLGKMLDQKQQTGKHLRPYLRNANVQWFHFDLTTVFKMDFDASAREAFRLQNGDLLICEGGEPGRAAIWRGQLAECYYQKALHRARPKKILANPEYLAWLLFFLSNWGGLGDHVTSATIAHLTGEKLKAMRIPLPPLDLQREFARRVAAVDKLKAAHRASLAEMDALFASLQHRAFRGEL